MGESTHSYHMKCQISFEVCCTVVCYDSYTFSKQLVYSCVGTAAIREVSVSLIVASCFVNTFYVLLLSEHQSGIS